MWVARRTRKIPIAKRKSLFYISVFVFVGSCQISEYWENSILFIRRLSQNGKYWKGIRERLRHGQCVLDTGQHKPSRKLEVRSESLSYSEEYAIKDMDKDTIMR